MSKAKPESATSSAAAPAVPYACRIRFVQEASGARTEGVRSYDDPLPMVAHQEVVPLTSLYEAPPAERPVDRELLLICLPLQPRGDALQAARQWLLADGANASTTPSLAELGLAELETEELKIAWRPGRAVLGASPATMPALIAAITDFSFYEGEVRTLEAEIAQQWAELSSDTAYTGLMPRTGNQRLGELSRSVEQQHQQNIRYARLSHRVSVLLDGHPRTVQTSLRRIMSRTRLLKRLRIVGEHLDVRHGVYESISHRLAEHQSIRASFLVELVIVLLLVIEVALSLSQLILNSGAE
jgi:hypothetical protein